MAKVISSLKNSVGCAAKHPRVTLVGIFILSSTIFPGCSSSAYVDYSTIISMENEMVKLVQEQPQIQGVKYTNDGLVSQPWKAEFTISSVKYVLEIGNVYKGKGWFPASFAIYSDDGEKTVMTQDYGGEQTPLGSYLGDLDGRVDCGQIGGKEYKRHTGENKGLRGDLQKNFNSTLKKI